MSTVSRPGPIVVVVNPTKFDDLGEVRQELSRLGTEHEVEIRVVETTEDDPGFGQTRTALDQGAAVVCALGGDGTVRAAWHGGERDSGRFTQWHREWMQARSTRV